MRKPLFQYWPPGGYNCNNIVIKTSLLIFIFTRHDADALRSSSWQIPCQPARHKVLPAHPKKCGREVHTTVFSRYLCFRSVSNDELHVHYQGKWTSTFLPVTSIDWIAPVATYLYLNHNPVPVAPVPDSAFLKPPQSHRVSAKITASSATSKSMIRTLPKDARQPFRSMLGP